MTKVGFDYQVCLFGFGNAAIDIVEAIVKTKFGLVEEPRSDGSVTIFLEICGRINAMKVWEVVARSVL